MGAALCTFFKKRGSTKWTSTISKTRTLKAIINNPISRPINPVPPAYDPTTQVMSIGQYVGMFILSALPVVNLICWIVWLCSPNTNKNKKNFIWANIIMWVISVVAMSLFLCLRRHRRFSAPCPLCDPERTVPSCLHPPFDQSRLYQPMRYAYGLLLLRSFSV